MAEGWETNFRVGISDVLDEGLDLLHYVKAGCLEC